MHYELQINTKNLRKTNRLLLNFNFDFKIICNIITAQARFKNGAAQ